MASRAILDLRGEVVGRVRLANERMAWRDDRRRQRIPRRMTFRDYAIRYMGWQWGNPEDAA